MHKNNEVNRRTQADCQRSDTQIEQERGTQICARFGLNDLLYKIDEAYLANDTLTV